MRLQSKREMIFFVLMVALLVLVLVLSGLFYIAVISGNSATTGHVVIRSEGSNQIDSSELSEKVLMYPNNKDCFEVS